MYSYEWLFALTGKPVWIDRLEALAFNNLPAAISPDMWTHQYDQMANQPECSRIPENAVHFSSNNGEAHLFGLEPHYGCCTANFGQGWPKFALSAFLRSNEGIVVASLVPAKLQTEVGGVSVGIETVSEYPFRDRAGIIVRTERAVTFELAVRIPEKAVATIDGNAAAPGLYRLTRTWQGETHLAVSLDFCVEWVNRPSGLTAVRRGPLTFALPVKEKWIQHEYTKEGVERKFPYCDYEIKPASPWNYGLCGETAELEEGETGEIPFSPEEPPLRLKVRGAAVRWEAANGVPAAFVEDRRALSPVEDLVLIPYGCTNLRMTELPRIETDD